jgi:SAM-dependent methyltransferase
VSFYGDRVVPRLVNFCCGMKSMDGHRERVCAGLSGRVVEIGFGSGLNVPHYPSTIESVTAVEPADLGWKLAEKRLAAATVPVQRAGLDGQSLPLGDDSFDAALVTWTLCTIPQPSLALAELRRVLVPGGRLHFVEHGLAPDDGVQTWQRRLEPVQKRVAGGCHLTRPVKTMVTDAGFELTEVDEFYDKGAPRAFAAFTLGAAVSR